MKATTDDLISTLDSGDGYLADAWLNRLRAFKFTLHEAARFLVWLPNIKPHLACCTITLSQRQTDLDKPAHFVEFRTGGWSGAEELINAMLGHFWIAYFHTKWERAGHFYFEIPDAYLSQPSESPPGPEAQLPDKDMSEITGPNNRA
jgi:hypothetical protein